MDMKKFFEKAERYFAAAAFAEEGEFTTAMLLRDREMQEKREVKRPVASQRPTHRLD